MPKKWFGWDLSGCPHIPTISTPNVINVHQDFVASTHGNDVDGDNDEDEDNDEDGDEDGDNDEDEDDDGIEDDDAGGK